MSQRFNSLKEENVIIGNHVEIKPFTVLGMSGFGFAKDPKTKKFKIPLKRNPHKFKLIIKDNVEIGAGCVIDRGSWRHSIIGKGTKLDNMVHTGHNTHIGENCMLCVGVTLGGSTTIGDFCQIGMNVIINPHITIADHVTIGSGSVVLKDINESNTTWAGSPARKIKDEQVSM